MTAKGRQRPSYMSHFRASSPSCSDQVGQRGPWEWGIQFLCDILTIPRPNWGRTAAITSSEKPTMAESQSWLQRRHCQSLTQLSQAGPFRELLVNSVQFSSVQSLSHVWLFATPWTAACQASLSITNSQSPPKPMSIELMMPSNHLILCCPLLFLSSIFPSIRAFSNESALLIRWPKYWSFSFNISPFKEHPGLIFFRMDWLDLPAVQGTLKSLLQHHSSKATMSGIAGSYDSSISRLRGIG